MNVVSALIEDRQLLPTRVHFFKHLILFVKVGIYLKFTFPSRSVHNMM